MAVTTIPWGDGSGDNIYLSAPSQTGDQSVSVTSDPNTGAARSKVVTFSASGVSPVTLNVSQEAGGVQHTETFYLSSYDSDNSIYDRISNISRAYSTDLASTTQGVIYLVQGPNGETFFYFRFNTSSIPANARIVSVGCKLVGRISSTNVTSRQAQMVSGTTLKGEAQTVPGSTTTLEFVPGEWTREELDGAGILLYGKRNSTTDISFQIRAAQLTVTYLANE